jgi:hypothetical protein
MEKLVEKDKKLILRSAEEIMRLTRMGSFHQTRLSFMRQLLRRMNEEKWTFSIYYWDINDAGFGTAIYSVKSLERHYSLIAFSKDLPANLRSDRVIATSWDLTFTLFDGIPSKKDVVRLKDSVPFQEGARLSKKELALGRANKSARLWDEVVQSLANGSQPSLESIESVGYLMRTTAVYGSGKFGLSDRVFIKDRSELAAPFQAELLSVYLVRSLVADLVEHVALKLGGDGAVKLSSEVRKRIGIGNSTGLGMAPFLVNHPSLLDRWMVARETAIARVRAIKHVKNSERSIFRMLLDRSIVNADVWNSQHPEQIKKLKDLRKDFALIRKYFYENGVGVQNFWDKICNWSQKKLTFEGQEALFSLILEPYGRIVDDLADQMSIDEDKNFRINGAMSCSVVIKIIVKYFSWALKYDYDKNEEQARFWYVSEEKLEPRLGERFEEDGAYLEQPLAVGRDIKAFYKALLKFKEQSILADFLLNNPEFRHTARRVLQFYKFSYGEIQDNLISDQMKPIDLLRCKLSFFGATRFDPRSDRWVRICMYQNAPYPNELNSNYDDFWPYPNLVKS